MASKELTEQLNELVSQASSIRNAVALIKKSKGCAPTKSSIDRAMKGSGTEYSVQCFIDDLRIGLMKQKEQEASDRAD